MHRREFLLSATGIVGATSVGSIAYTTANVERSVNSNVAADSSAIIGLSAGSVSGVSEDSNGQLSVDTTSGNGLNGGGTFTYGSKSSSTPAFTITNNDGSSHELTVGLKNLSPSGTFEMTVYSSGWSTTHGTVTGGTDQTMSNWGATETLNVTITIDTTGLTDSDSISGTMTFDAV